MALSPAEKTRRWKERHPEKAREVSRASKARRRDKIREEFRVWELQNRARRNAARRERYASDPEYRAKVLARAKSPGGRAAARNWKKKALATDPRYRLVHAIGCQMRDALGKSKALRSWQSLVGYSADELRAHLESQFEPWMTWSNYGPAWHIDHKRPVVSFDLPSQIKECWALSNLRPLCSIENMRKKDRIIPELID